MNSEFNALPVAAEASIFIKGASGDINLSDKKAIYNPVSNEVYCVASKGYVLAQHKDVFAEVLNAMRVDSDSKEVSFLSTKGRACMDVFTDKLVDDGEMGIKVGVRVWNSYDKSTALGLKYSQTVFDKTNKTIVFYGKRLVCANGMKILVPLSEMKAAEIDKLSASDVVAKEKYLEMASQINAHVVHYGKKRFEAKFIEWQGAVFSAYGYINEAIRNAKNTEITLAEFSKRLEEMALPKRIIEYLIDDFRRAKASNKWEAYNVITAYASHKINNIVRQDAYLEKAWGLMK